MFDALMTTDGLVSLLTLCALEIVLGIDNVIFISIIASRLPAEQQNKARLTGLAAALLIRVSLLFAISWIIGLKDDLFVIFGEGISGKDLILIGGGLFLIAKSTSEIHGKMAGVGHHTSDAAKKAAQNFAAVILQIILIDIVFSFDSILTAVGLVQSLTIMVIAVIVSTLVMILFVNPVSRYVDANPTIKMLALSFLIMIGLLLVAEGFEIHFPKGYIYFAMAYSFVVELLNIRLRKKSTGISG
jgi:predicted tellurium resistance membrane protein TerC